jgi:hypothetical protein
MIYRAEKRNVERNLVEKNKPLGRPRHRQEKNIKMDVVKGD